MPPRRTSKRYQFGSNAAPTAQQAAPSGQQNTTAAQPVVGPTQNVAATQAEPFEPIKMIKASPFYVSSKKTIIALFPIAAVLFLGGLFMFSKGEQYTKDSKAGYEIRARSTGMVTSSGRAAERLAAEAEKAAKQNSDTFIVTTLADVPLYSHPPIVEGQEMKSWTTIPKDGVVVKVIGDVGKTGWKRVSIECVSGKEEEKFATGYIQASTLGYTLPGGPLVENVAPTPQPTYWRPMDFKRVVAVKKLLGLIPKYK